MRKFITPVILALTMGVVAAQGAYAADTKAKTEAAPAKPAMSTTAKTSKHDSCESAWKAEKTHTAKHKDFVKSCEAKG